MHIWNSYSENRTTERREKWPKWAQIGLGLALSSNLMINKFLPFPFPKSAFHQKENRCKTVRNGFKVLEQFCWEKKKIDFIAYAGCWKWKISSHKWGHLYCTWIEFFRSLWTNPKIFHRRSFHLRLILKVIMEMRIHFCKLKLVLYVRLP